MDSEGFENGAQKSAVLARAHQGGHTGRGLPRPDVPLVHCDAQREPIVPEAVNDRSGWTRGEEARLIIEMKSNRARDAPEESNDEPGGDSLVPARGVGDDNAGFFPCHALFLRQARTRSSMVAWG